MMRLSWFLKQVHALLLFFSAVYPVARAHWPHDTVDAMAVSDDKRTIYVIVRKSLLWSTNAGISWQYIREIPKSIKRSFLAISPYDRTLYIYSGGAMTRSTNLIDWEDLPIKVCNAKYYEYMKRRATFTRDGVLIASWGGNLYKEDSNGRIGFMVINNPAFANCPSLAAVPGSDVVYAGGSNGLWRSDDGGINWTLIVRTLNVIEVVANEGQVFVMKKSRICRLNDAQDDCEDINLPKTTAKQRMRAGLSPPLAMSYKDGCLIVTRVNSQAVYYTNDFGETWQKRRRDLHFTTPGHNGLSAWEFDGTEEFTHADQNFVGGWTGVFSTIDGGRTWTYHDTIRKAITYFHTTTNRNGDVTAVACTYADGCYKGSPAAGLVPYPIEDGFYESLHYSPFYDIDGVGFENTKRALYRTDETNSRVALPGIVQGGRISIKSIVFSPAFSTDGTIFVAGYNLGVMISQNKGQTFTRSLDDYDVVRLVLSPNYSVDGTMACLVDPGTDGKPFDLEDTMYIYFSRNFGDRWQILEDEGKPWRDLVIIVDVMAPIVVAIDRNGAMFAHSTSAALDGTGFGPVGLSSYPSRPLGFGSDGLAVSPDGRLLAAAFAEGGMMFGRVMLGNSFGTKVYYIEERRDTDVKRTGDIPLIFAKAPSGVDDVDGRTFSSKISFSPSFSSDSTLFAADMLGIYKSTNEGRDWTKESIIP